jgi:putative hydrolase of the HAD superfamily
MVADHQGGGRDGGVSDTSRAPKSGGPDALLFDLGGVVIDIDFNRAFAHWAKHAGCDEQLVRERFSQDTAYCRHEVGEIGVAEYFASLRTSLGIDLSDAQFLDGWNAFYIGEIPGIAALLARVRIPLYAFTNTNRAHEACWSAQFAEIMPLFRKIFVSSTIGLRKPERAAFEFVVREIGVPAGRIVFFDDNPDNVAGARACGLQAVHVTSHADVGRTLAALDLIR